MNRQRISCMPHLCHAIYSVCHMYAGEVMSCKKYRRDFCHEEIEEVGDA